MISENDMLLLNQVNHNNELFQIANDLKKFEKNNSSDEEVDQFDDFASLGNLKSKDFDEGIGDNSNYLPVFNKEDDNDVDYTDTISNSPLDIKLDEIYNLGGDRLI